MNKLLFVAIMFMTSVAGADYVKWDASTSDPACVDGYILYFNNLHVDVGNVTEYNLSPLDLESCTLYNLSVKAYNKAGLSEKSNEVPYVVVYDPPEQVQNVRIEKVE